MRVHLVSPAFHGYWRSICAAFAARGHDVTVHCYDENPTKGDRLRHQLGQELPRRLGHDRHEVLALRQTEAAIRSVRASAPDRVVVVKGDTLGDGFWACVDDARVPRVTWLYDELRRTRYDRTLLGLIGPVATYSPSDDAELRAAGLDSRLLPLAFDHRLVEVDGRRRDGEITFIGARYPERERVLSSLAGAGLPVRAYGRDWSRHPADRLRTWDLRRPPVPAGRDLHRADAYRVMAASAATLNLHGDQDGFTMRTFEAAGVGGVQVVDREDVDELYEPGVELVVAGTDAERRSWCERALRDPSWADAIREAGRRRTLAHHTFDHRVAVLEAAWAPA